MMRTVLSSDSQPIIRRTSAPAAGGEYWLSCVVPVPDTMTSVPPFITIWTLVSVQSVTVNAKLPERSVVAHLIGSKNSATVTISVLMSYVKSEPSSVAPNGTHGETHESVNFDPTTVLAGSADPAGALNSAPGSVSRFGVAIVKGMSLCPSQVFSTRKAPGTSASAPTRQNANHPPCPVGRPVVVSLIIGSYITLMPIRSTIAYCLKSP